MASTSRGIQDSSDGVFTETTTETQLRVDRVKYKVLQGANKENEGKSYEEQVAAFVTLEALKFDNFFLLDNVEECLPLDDLILLGNKDDSSTLYFFQVKYNGKRNSMSYGELMKDLSRTNNKVASKKEQNGATKKLPIKDYDSAKEATLELLSEKLKDEIFVKIIYFTTKQVDLEKLSDLEQDKTNKIFNSKRGCVFKFKEDFIKEENDEEQMFLRSINIYSQPTNLDTDLIDFIREYFKEYFNLKDEVTVIKIKLTYCNYIKNWCKNKREKESLSRAIVFRLLMLSFFKIYYTRITYNENEYQKYLQIFSKECLDVLWKFIVDNSVNLTIRHGDFVKAMLKDDLDKFDEVSHVDHKYFKQLLTDDLLCFQMKELAYDLGRFVGKLPIVLDNFNCPAETKKYLEDFRIVNLTTNVCEDQQMFGNAGELPLVLQQQRITTCSGQNFSIADIVDGMTEKISLSEILSLILDSQKNTPDKDEILIPRKLNKIIFDGNIFLGTTLFDVFIIYTNKMPFSDFVSKIRQMDVRENDFLVVRNKTEIQNYLSWLEKTQNQTAPSDDTSDNRDSINYKIYKFILIENFIDLDIRTPETINVHFLKLIKSYNNWRPTTYFELFQTIGSTKNIMNFRTFRILHSATSVDQVDEVFKGYCDCCVKLQNFYLYFKNSILVISGIPGIGKTTYLKQLAQTTNTDFILLVNLLEHYNDFENFKNQSALELVKYFYSKENSILQNFIYNKLVKKEITILFDALDEVAPKFTNIVTDIIKKINYEQIKIVLTTRSVLEHEVKNKFGVFANSLCPYNKMDQIKFLKLYFIKYGNNLSIDCHEYVESVFANMHVDIAFFKVPFNLQLIAEVILREIESGKFSTSNYNLNQLELYKKFISYRLKIYAEKFNKKDMYEPIIFRYHKYFSIKLLFNYLPDYCNIQDLLKDILQVYVDQLQLGLEKTGLLINDINEIFIHRTVAEFFAAKWLFEVFKPSSGHQLIKGEKEFALIVIKIINSSNDNFEYDRQLKDSDSDVGGGDNNNFPVIKLFFDLIINENTLHMNAFQGNYKDLLEKLEADITTSYSLNNFNRSLFHTIISKNDLFYNKGTLKADKDLVRILKLLFNTYNRNTKDFSEISVQDFVENQISNKPPLKIILHEKSVYCSRNFMLWELFLPNNLYKCNINQLLEVIEMDQDQLFTIFDAAMSGNLHLIRQFYNSGINMNIGTELGKKLLKLAAKSGSVDVIKFLIKDKVKTGFVCFIKFLNKGKVKILQSIKWECNRSISHYAVISGNVDLIRYLIENKLDFISYDKDGLAAFHYAIIFNKTNIVTYLLEHINVNFPSDNGDLPIQFAVAYCNKNVLKFFLEKGADLNCKGMKGETLLHLAISVNHWINNFCKHQLKFSLKSKHFSVIYDNYKKRYIDFFKFLLLNGLDINACDKYGQTPLMYALNYGNEELIKCLIENSADINCVSQLGCNAFHAGVYKCNTELFKLFLKNNIDINAKDNRGNTVLHYAARQRMVHSFEIVEFLLKNNANPKTENNTGATALHLAGFNRNVDVVKLLVNQSTINAQTVDRFTPLHVAIIKNNFKMVKMLIENQADVNLPNGHEHTPLDMANYLGWEEIALYLKSKNGTCNSTASVEEDLYDDYGLINGIYDIPLELPNFNLMDWTFYFDNVME